jgi:hypothetical protein
MGNVSTEGEIVCFGCTEMRLNQFGLVYQLQASLLMKCLTSARDDSCLMLVELRIFNILQSNAFKRSLLSIPVELSYSYPSGSN